MQIGITTVLVACQQGPTCSGNKSDYNGKCPSNMAITYMECTKNRGFDLTTELSGKLGGTFKVIADASIEAAYKVQQDGKHGCRLVVAASVQASLERAGAASQEDASGNGPAGKPNPLASA
ncbi:hypothetical protein LR392_04975 [Arthrobacter sp. AK04]|uniref:hypothetical protein n=1 Tax=Arthrobacter sp. AK04 TaxID=2900048 RepID=UPI001E392521|nr:hypothetical protein [Arthrobacter sp. AK04]MCD5341580.1 hypothetical protein [Arthrobacter sp. AK04]